MATGAQSCWRTLAQRVEHALVIPIQGLGSYYIYLATSHYPVHQWLWAAYGEDTNRALKLSSKLSLLMCLFLFYKDMFIFSFANNSIYSLVMCNFFTHIFTYKI